ncbi:tripartite tricarboxylate transporter TctB family protein [Xanthobacteraceae bacterium Astr-EGSB]|uniref:tripartite tricarboxylate transporter TctB family protein n=1 Tax=Astrobacterium formosum TaxID=3069710 RepID=UPI0027AFF154|nr:tripartite tricarboxylate transporter TctB family protein [Xanthobacteraceae bacterium Astr-EGSB]
MISRFNAELATAAATAAVGAVTVFGALEYGIGWDMAGPEPGAFPFYIGIMVMLASGATAVKTVANRPVLASREFLDRHRLGRIGVFFGLMTGFVVLSMLIGLYVATVVYVTAAVWWQGGYKPWIGAACGVSAALFFYVVLEKGFQVPLLKGPLEAAFGIY